MLNPPSLNCGNNFKYEIIIWLYFSVKFLKWNSRRINYMFYQIQWTLLYIPTAAVTSSRDQFLVVDINWANAILRDTSLQCHSNVLYWVRLQSTWKNKTKVTILRTQPLEMCDSEESKGAEKNLTCVTWGLIYIFQYWSFSSCYNTSSDSTVTVCNIWIGMPNS
jgi:hypothetical protein